MAWDLSNVTFQNDALNAESRDAFANAYGWQGVTDPRGSTKAQFRAWCIKQFVREVTRGERVKVDQAGQAARVGDPDVS